ncbi:LysR family transcriptional regulator [Aliiroseovarius sp. 2305UL8-7]|uniref:LysR family transcriptional regulator n=1 Tax=Aliiroseovarius conchicola TaxID=3121637 RepID=UPI00352845EB
MKKFNSWSHLQTILAVVDAGSYRAAGELLGVTSSTVARHIDAISEELGHPIFVPKGNFRELTDVGKQLVSIADKTQTNLSFLMKNLENESERFGSVQISTLSFVCSDFLAQYIDTWRRDNPDAKLIIDATDRTTAVERGEADVALRLSRPDTAGISRFKVANCRVALFSPSRQSDAGWIGLSGSLDDLPEMRMAREHFGCSPAVRLESYRAIARASSSTGLPCVIPTCLARNYPDMQIIGGSRVPVTVNRELWFLFYEKRNKDPAIIAARNWIKKVFPSANKCLCGKCGG